MGETGIRRTHQQKMLRAGVAVMGVRPMMHPVTYLDAFSTPEHFAKFLPEYENLDAMKDHYRRGGLGDGTCKKFLFNIMEDMLQPIRERRAQYEQNIPQVYEILRKGSEVARAEAAKTLADVRKAMKIDYFDDAELIAEHTKKFQK